MQDEGKDGESEEDSNKIVYDDKMIADMLDRNKVAEEEKAVAYNDYLQVMSHLLLSVASSALAKPFFFASHFISGRSFCHFILRSD